MKMASMGMVMVAIVMVAGMTGLVEGQSSTPSCAEALVPCANYLNSTKPPASCCTPLNKTVATQLQCLCNLLNDTSLFQSLKINLTQALGLSKNCGLADTTAACSKFSASPVASPTTSATPTPSGAAGNGVRKLAWSGVSCLVALLASMMVIKDLGVL
ncbi:non-specific lipid transfer protein GPI-anchored 3-like [Macadamia integrifolia]|uniref:non-specific lipid transfer protein GPI-anchored 3-like n=1 Tax=Macadamia integrifolia TaxID=60698 RepID=UPI001C4FA436|nr:non-specific lipid transfer protein GPI-anchored 3-like [Macadamia integrifolia]